MEWTAITPTLVTTVIAICGWWIGHYLASKRDLRNERRKLRNTFLLEAYRRLESTANRKNKTPEQAIAFEAALADIQLLGNTEQVNAVFMLFEQFKDKPKIDDILKSLRRELRQEMDLTDVEKVTIFRFEN
jgi:hypothetical protein